MKFAFCTAICIAALPFAAFAEAERPASGVKLSGSLGLVSDYIDRGLTYTGGKPAWQGSLQLTFANGFYTGLWVSRFKDAAEPDIRAEGLLYAGWNGTWSVFTVDASVTLDELAARDGTFHSDNTEFDLRLGHSFDAVEIAGTLAYIPDDDARSGPWWSYSQEINWSVTDKLTASAIGSYQWISDNAAYGLPDYFDGELLFEYALEPITLQAATVWSDLSKSECGDVCGARIVLGISYAF